ncbi:MAG: GIY-YIG nuclease family protein [Coriobacteriia bacterium]|nr:GIY-YIG nuclease family protein [Coriobacteriia bacterium]
MSAGYVYIMSNPAMPGLLKIGMTRNDVRQRASELAASTGVPARFVIEYYCLTGEPEAVEAQVHSHFSAYRAPGREFFSLPLRDAVLVVDEHIRPVVPERYCRLPAEELHPPANSRVRAESGGTLKLPDAVVRMRGARRYEAIIRLFAESSKATATLAIAGVDDKTLWQGLVRARNQVGAPAVVINWPAGGMVRLSRGNAS